MTIRPPAPSGQVSGAPRANGVEEPCMIPAMPQVRILGRARPRPANRRAPERTGHTGYGYAACCQTAVLTGAPLACHDRAQPWAYRSA
jgi:hypothetical protein